MNLCIFPPHPCCPLYCFNHHFPVEPLVSDLKSQVHELKQAQTAEGSQLHRMLIDPAVNLVFSRMKAQLSDYKEKLEQAQTDLSAWKFTPDRLAETEGFSRQHKNTNINLETALTVADIFFCSSFVWLLCIVIMSVNFDGHCNSWLNLNVLFVLSFLSSSICARELIYYFCN